MTVVPLSGAAGRRGAEVHPLAEAALFDGVPEPYMGSIDRGLPVIEWNAGDIAPAALVQRQHLYLIRAGLVATAAHAPRGPIVAAVLQPGAVYSSLGCLHRPTVIAFEDALVSPMGRPTLERLMALLPVVAMNLARLLSQRAAELRLTAAIVSHVGVEERLLMRLVQLAGSIGVPTPWGVGVPHRLTHAQWGLLINASREAVTSAFGRLRARGLVSTVDGRVFVGWGNMPG
jgi:CRP-like cAMP-binding protein